MDVTIKTITVEDIERRRAEIKKIIQTPEFQERVRENALLRRKRALFDEQCGGKRHKQFKVGKRSV